jgi:cytochrome o ubiquinol oxidase subunit II
MTKKQRQTYKFVSISLLILVVLFLIGWWLHRTDIAVLDPKGIIAAKEYHLIVLGTLLSVLIIVPVFVMTFMIVWKYRVDKHTTHTKYRPDWDHDRKFETIWWGVPLVLILIIAGITWQSSHDLDPFKPIAATVSDKPPLKVQVVALQWKWLFIYPEQGVASVNYLQFPADTPIDFQITADSPMNSFWIPKLGGQIYAMSGMSTQLHLMADQPGEFRGVSANLSGEGFAGMNFMVRAVPNDEFSNWVQNIKSSAGPLDTNSYARLAHPSKDNAPTFYNVGNDNPSVSLYDTVVAKYMAPTAKSSNTTTNSMDNMSGMNSSSSGPTSELNDTMMMQGMQHGAIQ